MENLHIEYIDITKLTHFADNAKIHTKEQILHIANSIKLFGFNDPVGIVGEENIILEGNGRVEAAKLLNMETLPCVRLDHLSEQDAKAYVIAHNALNLETSFDDGILFKELKKLENYDFTALGIKAEKYLKTCIRVQNRVLKQLSKVHYLISVDINKHNELVEQLRKIQQIEGIEIESTIN